MANVKPNLEVTILDALRQSERGLRPSELTQQMQRVGSAADIRRVMERLVDRGKIEISMELRMKVPSQHEG